jgi:hypothetical protein
MRQMSYSLCRFWAYDESKKIIGAGKSSSCFPSSDYVTHLQWYRLRVARFATFLL